MVIAKALRELGIEADSLQYYRTSPARYNATINVCIGNWSSPLGRLKSQLNAFISVYKKYDIYHFHFGRSLLPFFLDLPVLKLSGKKIVFEYHGSDMRNPFKFVNPFSLPRKTGLLIKQGLVKFVSKLFVDAEIVTTPDMLEFAPRARYIPAAIDSAWITASRGSNPGDKKRKKIVVIHAPSSQVIKGTKYVISAIAELKKEGIPVELGLVEKVSPDKLRVRVAAADIAIDQLLIGWYGLFAAEAMMLGKPVICYIRSDLRKYMPELPIVSAGPENLADVLKKTIKDYNLQEKLSIAGPIFARKHHESRAVAKKFLDIYKSLYSHRSLSDKTINEFEKV